MAQIFNIINISLAALFVLFLPGFALSFLFFGKGKIDAIERIALSFALSIAVVPLVTFYTNLIGIPITKLWVMIQITAILAIVGLILAVKLVIEKLTASKRYMYHKSHPAIHPAKKTHHNRFTVIIYVVSDELFKASLVTYLLLLIAETVKEGFVTYFFNPNILLGVVIVSGIAMAITRFDREEDIKQNNAINWFYIYCMSFLGAALVYIKTQELETLSIIISVTAFLLIGLLSYLVFAEKE